MRIIKAFTDHPASVGESYLEHLRSALGFSLTMLATALCCGVHAFFPFLLERSGSRAIDELHRRMVRDRARTPRETSPAAVPKTADRCDRAAA